MKVTRTCPITGKENSKELDCTQEQMDNWRGGMLAQKAFPHLSADDREFIMTGITPEVWDELFPEE